MQADTIKKLLLMVIIQITIITGVIFLRPNATRADSTNTITPEFSHQLPYINTYVIWSPIRTTPWVYTNVIGGMIFMNYNHANDFSHLQSDFITAINNTRPNLIELFLDWRDMQPLIFNNGNSMLPEGSNTLSQVIDTTNLTLDYVKDFFDIAWSRGIDVIILPNVSSYGGTAAYPFSYYSKTGWFWKRPDWPWGLADPTTDAMRHPTAAQNGSPYDWDEHRANYDMWSSAKHLALTSNGTEMETLTPAGAWTWNVYESPDMVFNGYDTILHNNTLHLHSPIVSFSSSAYRNTTYDVFQKLASGLSNKHVLAYDLFQEPSYAHLRENMNGCGQIWNDPRLLHGVGNTCNYDVDYSEAEKTRYNTWRQSQGLSPVSTIPFQPDATYDAFRKYNLASFLGNLQNGLFTVNPNSKTLYSIFINYTLTGMAVDIPTMFSTLNPSIMKIEPPAMMQEIMEMDPKNGNHSYNPGYVQSYINSIRQASSVTALLSTNTGTPNNDPPLATQLGANGFQYLWVPNHYTSNDPQASYPMLLSDLCATNCTFRYTGRPVPPTPSAAPPATLTPTPTIVSNLTPTPTPTPISPSHCQPLGDVDCSGQVNSLDFTMLISKFGSVPAGTPEDLDDSLTVNSSDLTLLLLNFGNILPPTSTPSLCAPAGSGCKTNESCCSSLCLNNTCAVIVPQ